MKKIIFSFSQLFNIEERKIKIKKLTSCLNTQVLDTSPWSLKFTKDLSFKAKDLGIKAKDLEVKAKDLESKAKDLRISP